MTTLAALATTLLTWLWPLATPVEVARPFQPPSSEYGPGHRGVDLAGRVGQPVLAAGAGVVSVAGLLAGRGVVVVVHGRLRTTYEPVHAMVRVGQVVLTGAELGTLEAGHVSCPTSACLHWGLRRGEAYLDPLTLVGKGRLRLLPLNTAGRQARAADPPPWTTPMAGDVGRQGPASAERAPPPAAPGPGSATASLAASALAVAAGAWMLRRIRR